MRLSTVVILFFSTLLHAQGEGARQKPAMPVCEKDRPVDDYIKELTKSKRSTRTKNPLPDNVCIFGFCLGGKPQPQRPPAQTEPSPEPEENAYDPIGGAKSTEVGDYYFEEKNYRAAFSRYEEALTLKPGDPTIYLRMGRTLERMDDGESAYKAYDSALKLEADGKSGEEAKKAMERLRPQLEKEGAEPADISRTNQPPRGPCINSVTEPSSPATANQ
jgi:tetratricopeptide (TPR) repeat protein